MLELVSEFTKLNKTIKAYDASGKTDSDKASIYIQLDAIQKKIAYFFEALKEEFGNRELNTKIDVVSLGKSVKVGEKANSYIDSTIAWKEINDPVTFAKIASISEKALKEIDRSDIIDKAKISKAPSKVVSIVNLK